MPRETCTAPAILPLFSTSGASRTSTTSVLPLPIISRAWLGVIFGTAALAASIICFRLVAIWTSLGKCRRHRNARRLLRLTLGLLMGPCLRGNDGRDDGGRVCLKQASDRLHLDCLVDRRRRVGGIQQLLLAKTDRLKALGRNLECIH